MSIFKLIIRIIHYTILYEHVKRHFLNEKNTPQMLLQKINLNKQ